MKILAPHLEHYFEGNPVLIDKSLYDVIIKFNKLGYVTYSCCSGLPEDHEGEDDRNCGFYVAFAADIPNEYVVLASSYGFRCDLWKDRPWIGTGKNKIENVDDCVRDLIKSWNRQLDKELESCKQIPKVVSFVRELFRLEATT